MSHEPDYEEVLRELVRQGWRLDPAGRGNGYKAFPPDKSKPMVVFAEGTERRALRNAISNLRHSGFVWPPPEPPRRDPALESMPPEEAAAFNARMSAELVKRRNGHAVDLPKPVPPEIAAAAPTPDDLFVRLKRARDSHALAVDCLRDAENRLKETERERDEAVGEVERTADGLRLAKQAFDEAFGAVEVRK